MPHKRGLVRAANPFSSFWVAACHSHTPSSKEFGSRDQMVMESIQYAEECDAQIAGCHQRDDPSLQTTETTSSPKATTYTALPGALLTI